MNVENVMNAGHRENMFGPEYKHFLNYILVSVVEKFIKETVWNVEHHDTTWDIYQETSISGIVIFQSCWVSDVLVMNE